MLSLTALRGEVKDDLGDTLTGLYSDIDVLIERWLNRGQERMDWQFRKTADITWAAGDPDIDLPADFARWGRFISDTGSGLPSGHEIGLVYEIHSAGGAPSAGEGRLIYWAYPPVISSGQASTLPRIGDVALIEFAKYSFYARLSSSRSDFEKYSVLVGQNGVDLEEIRALAREHYDDYVAASNSMPRSPSVSYYGD